MSNGLNKASRRFACALTIAMAYTIAASHLHAQHPQSRTRIDNSLLQGEKFQIGEIVTLLRSVRTGRLKQSRLIEAIQSRGIAFPASELNLARLMNSGAAEPVLETIEKLGATTPLPPVAAEPPKPTYRFTVTCEPAECETRIGDDAFHATVDGKFTFTGIRPGRLILDARKDGFETRTEIVTLDPAALTGAPSFEHTITLTPTDATQRQWGAALLSSVLGAAKVTPQPIAISGSLTVTDSGVTEWKLTAHLSPDGANSLDLDSPQGRVTYVSVSGFWQSKSSFHKSPFHGTRAEKTKAESTLLRNIDVWIAYEYSSIMHALANAGVVAMSRTDPSSAAGPKLLEVKTSRGSESISFTPDRRLSTILFSNSPASNQPARIEFSDYRNMADGFYPARTLIRFADSESHAVVLQTSKVELDKSPPRAP